MAGTVWVNTRFNAISGMDINGTTAVVAFSGLCTLSGALLSDILVAVVDPRVRVS